MTAETKMCFPDFSTLLVGSDGNTAFLTVSDRPACFAAGYKLCERTVLDSKHRCSDKTASVAANGGRDTSSQIQTRRMHDSANRTGVNMALGYQSGKSCFV